MQCRKPLGQVRPRGRVHVTGPPRWPCLASDLSVRLRGCVLPRRGRALVGAGREAIQPPRVDFIGKLRVGCMDRMVTGPRSHAKSDVAAGRSVTSTRRCVQSLCVLVPAGQCAAFASGALRPEPPVVVCAKAMRLAGRVLRWPAATGDSKSEAQALTSQKRHHPLCAVHVRFVCARFPPRPAGVARAVRSGGGDRAWSRISQHNYVI